MVQYNIIALNFIGNYFIQNSMNYLISMLLLIMCQYQHIHINTYDVFILQFHNTMSQHSKAIQLYNSLSAAAAVIEQNLWELNSKNYVIGKEIEEAEKRRGQLVSIRDSKIGGVRACVDSIKHSIGQMERKFIQNIGVLQKNIMISNRQMQICHQQKIPQFDYTYIINSPLHLSSLREKHQETMTELTRQRARRQDQIRTLKIKISLAEIQLKELLNRKKKN